MTRVTAVVVVFLALTFVTPASADEVTEWNQMMFRANVVAATSPLVISRTAAIVSVAMFDAVNGIERRYAPFYVTATPPAGASKNAAAAQAAYTALVALLPAQKGLFDTRLAVSKAALSARESTASITSGAAWGATVANAILALRATDGLADVIPPFFGNAIVGVWRATPPGFLPFAGAQFSDMAPWVIASPSAFRPAAPPALTSAQYTKDFNEVKKFGRSDSAFRTPDQTVFSWFWNTSTAPALWNGVAVALLERADDRWDDDRGDHGHGWSHSSLLKNARTLALLNLSMADAAIGCWDAKWLYQYWRPVTAIAQADADGNPDTAADATWAPLFPTPAHSEYPSGHSCVSGAAGRVLESQFGEHTRFDVESDAMPRVSCARSRASRPRPTRSRTPASMRAFTSVRQPTLGRTSEDP
jgi:hypothetical protein